MNNQKLCTPRSEGIFPNGSSERGTDNQILCTPCSEVTLPISHIWFYIHCYMSGMLSSECLSAIPSVWSEWKGLALLLLRLVLLHYRRTCRKTLWISFIILFKKEKKTNPLTLQTKKIMEKAYFPRGCSKKAISVKSKWFRRYPFWPLIKTLPENVLTYRKIPAYN